MAEPDAKKAMYVLDKLRRPSLVLSFQPRPTKSVARQRQNLGMSKHAELTAAHAIWDEANRKVRACERLLAAALSDYEKNKAPLPTELMAEVQAMRLDCQAKFKALMAAMRHEPDANASDI